MDILISEQKYLYGRIARLTENMKKLGTSKITKGVIISRLELLETYWTTFLQTHSKLCASFKEEHQEKPYFKDDHMSLCEEAYLQQKASLLDTRDDFPDELDETVHTGTDSQGRTLERIPIPKFSGDYQNWPSFRDLFRSLVIKNSNLSEVDKLHYLQTSLTDEAARLIQNVTLTTSNFKRAWETIMEQYDVPRLLIHAHVTKLLSLPAMKKESAQELKELLHGTRNAVDALATLKLPVEHWSAFLVVLTAERLDPTTRMAWEMSIGTAPEHPTFDQMKTFLSSQVRALVASGGTASGSAGQNRSGSDKNSSGASTGAARRPKTHCVKKNANGTQKCALCQGEHFILYCPKYKAMSPLERKNRVDEQLAHSGKSASPSLSPTTATTHCAQVQSPGASVLLATALVRVASNSGEKVTVRAMIDPCSEVSLIGESIAQLLRLPRSPTNIPVIGVAKNKTYSRGSRISSYRPSPVSVSTSWFHLTDLELADPEFASSRKVDILLGAEVYSQIIREGLRHGPPCTPVAQATTLGWILTGLVGNPDNFSKTKAAVTLQCTTDFDISEILQKFWKQEEVSAPLSILTAEEKACEDHFVRTHSRDNSGSDCGTNFVGADKELRRLFSDASDELGKLAPLLADLGTTWIFNPPAAPHFGGIWESAVKSMKHHLRRVIGDTPLTFEEMTTLLNQIEACLNSRPLLPLSDEPDNFQFLTPGHFLVGSALIAIPEPSLTAESSNRLARWQKIQQMRDHYWKRWSAEYLQALQGRPKWIAAHPNVQPGQLCLVKNEATPPTHWPIGRITEVHPGPDGLVRVVTIRTPKTTLQRPIAKISLFPSEPSDEAL
ncbi:uncharacterized protein LOC143377086 [Andrena cerasifolii]|uniref:uncharacterized protein LOC143377086 n=1 Tax=Andrena cerasifolii TaxID=2819439 RepID=UPI0040377963